MFEIHNNEGFIAAFKSIEQAIRAIDMCRKEIPSFIFEIKKDDMVLKRFRGPVELPLESKMFFRQRI